MKLLFTTEIIQRAGKERQMLLLCRELLARGHDVRVLSIYATPLDYLQEYGIAPDRVRVIGDRGKLKKYRRMRDMLKEFAPDIVFAWDPLSALYAVLMRRRLRFSMINGSIQHGIWLWRPYYVFRNLVCRLSPYVVANSYAGLRANRLAPGRRRFVLHNGIEEKFVNRLTAAKVARRRAEWIPGFTENPGTVYVSVANFVPFKDYDTVLDAMARLRGQRSFYYLILGDGPNRKEIVRRIRANRLDDRVVLVGRSERVADFLHIGDCLIHSSRGEGVSNAILEAMFAGLPVIATEVGGIPETVFPASSILFPYKDSEALLRCLLAVDRLTEGFDPCGAAYQAHLSEFSVARMIDRFLQIARAVSSGTAGKDIARET